MRPELSPIAMQFNSTLEMAVIFNGRFVCRLPIPAGNCKRTDCNQLSLHALIVSTVVLFEMHNLNVAAASTN